jgi:hypothetical protein
MFRLLLLKQRNISSYLKKINIKFINRSSSTGPINTALKPPTEWFKKILFNIKNSKYKSLTFAAYSIRVLRIVGLTFVVYNLGYRNGLIFYAKDSRKADLELMNVVLNSTSENEVGYYDKSSPLYTRAEKVGRRIITSAKSMCKEKLIECTKLVIFFCLFYKYVALLIFIF